LPSSIHVVANCRARSNDVRQLHEIGIVEMNSLKEQFVRAFIVPEKARPLFIAA
jgi:hypothetical protein